MRIFIKHVLNGFLSLFRNGVYGCSTYTHYQEDLREIKAVMAMENKGEQK